MSPTGRCSETARTGCSVAKATVQRLRGGSDSPLSADLGRPESRPHLRRQSTDEARRQLAGLSPRPAAIPWRPPTPSRGRTAAAIHGSLASAYPAAVGSPACAAASDRLSARYSAATDGSAVNQSRNSKAQRHPAESLTLKWRLRLRPGSAFRAAVCASHAGPRRPGAGCPGRTRPRPGTRPPSAPAPESSAVCRSGTVSCRSMTSLAGIPGSRSSRCDPPWPHPQPGTPWPPAGGRRPATADPGRPTEAPTAAPAGRRERCPRTAGSGNATGRRPRPPAAPGHRCCPAAHRTAPRARRR